jgi:hypothetical protein
VLKEKNHDHGYGFTPVSSQDCVGLDFSPFLSINMGWFMTTYTDNYIVGFYRTESYLKLVPKPLDCCRV